MVVRFCLFKEPDNIDILKDAVRPVMHIMPCSFRDKARLTNPQGDFFILFLEETCALERNYYFLLFLSYMLSY